MNSSESGLGGWAGVGEGETRREGERVRDGREGTNREGSEETMARQGSQK